MEGLVLNFTTSLSDVRLLFSLTGRLYTTEHEGMIFKSSQNEVMTMSFCTSVQELLCTSQSPFLTFDFRNIPTSLTPHQLFPETCARGQ